MKRNLLVWNGGSGKAGGLEAVRTAFDDTNSVVLEMTRSVDLVQAIGEATESGCRTVVAAGGDGTVNAVVNALMQSHSSIRPNLAILPLGTANDFAGTLGIPDDLDQALHLIDAGPAIPVDVVRIVAADHERYFANVAAGGNSVRVSEEMTDEIKARWGAFCYLRGAMGVLGDLQTYRITAECDSERFEALDAWAVLVANGRTNAGRIVVAPAASTVDGLMDVIIVRNGDVMDILEIVSEAVLGNFLDCEQVIFRQVRSLKLHSEPGMRFTLDGEVIDREPVQFEVVPGAIRMVVGSRFYELNSQAAAHV